jgi:hypothetical protein
MWVNTGTSEGWILTANDGSTAVWAKMGAQVFGRSFIDFYDATSAPPGSPSTGDNYVLDTGTPVDAGWTVVGATNDDFVEWSGSAWTVSTPVTGQISYNTTLTDFYIYDGADWILLSGSISGVTFVSFARAPMTSDNTQAVPTIWLNTVLDEAWLLSGIDTGVAKWLKLSSNTLGDAQDSVISIAVSTSAPPSEVLGDRYILDSSGAPHADWDGASQNDIVQFDGATWVALTPSEGTFCEVEDVDTVYIFITSWVKLFQHTGAIFDTNSGTAAADATGTLRVVGNASTGSATSGATNVITIANYSATTTQKGVSETSTNAESIAKVSTTTTLTPSNVPSIHSSPGPIGDVLSDTGTFTHVDYVNAAAPAYVAGRVFYDSATDALSFYNAESDVALQIGEENWVKVRNETGSTITNGNIVYLNGSSSGFPLIVKAIATAESSSMVIGVVTHDIENNSNGYVTTFGLVRSLNTSTFSGGDIIYLSDTVAGSITTTKPDSKTEWVVRIGVIGAVDVANGTFHVNICCGGSLSDINSYTFNDNGFDDPKNEATTSFVNGTRTLTIAPQVSTFTYWSEGVAFKKSASEDIIIPDTEGSHYIYYDGDTLSQSMTWSLDFITKYALVEIIYWDAANNVQIYFGDEFFHGTKMGSMTHGYLHDTVGFALESGAGLTDILEDESGDLDSHAEFGVEATVAYDEDAEFEHSAHTSTDNIAVYYKSNTEASPYWRTDETASFGVLTTGTGRAAYNFLTGGNWTQAEVSNNDFVLAHVFTFNDSTRKYGIIQGENSYLTRSAARDGANTEINDITIDGLIGPEIKFIGTVIYQTNDGYANAVKSRIRSTDTGDEYVDLRDFPFTRGGVSGTLTDHGALTGLGDDDHVQYLLADGTRSLAGAWDMGSQNLTNVDIDSGSIDSTPIGSVTPSTGAFTTLSSSTSTTTPLVTAGAGTDLVVKMGDAAGSNKVSFTDSADAEQASMNSDGLFKANKIGVGTTTVPHGGVGGGLVAVEGVAGNVDTGAHMQFTTTSDDYPLIQVLPWSHDNVNIFLDGYRDSGGQRSSSSSGCFRIKKGTDQIEIAGDTGIAAGSSATYEDILRINANGYITMPLQSCVQANPSVALSITGNNTLFTMTSYTERFDLNNDFASGTYTAPIAAYMHVGMNIIMQSAAGGSNYLCQMTTSNKTYEGDECGDNTTSGFMHLQGNCFADMDAADTCVFKVRINGIGADTASVNSGYVYIKIGC